MITIDRNIPIPGRPDGRGKPAIYPFAEMEVGDSFAIPLDSNKLMSAAVKWKARHPGWNYRTRSDSGVIRLWRTA